MECDFFDLTCLKLALSFDKKKPRNSMVAGLIYIYLGLYMAHFSLSFF